MKYDELAFLNQQLAAMLRDGVPLEGSLKQLCATMRRGELRSELLELEADLARGVPLSKAVEARKLPEFYALMVQIGARTNDMPGMLTLLADYYQNAHSIWTRLKGMMVYPVIVLIMALGLSVMLSMTYGQVCEFVGQSSLDTSFATMISDTTGQLWLPPLTLAAVAVIVIGAVSLRGLRRRLVWRLPAFKEASLARFSSAMSMLLGAGCTLDQALALTQQLESGTPAGSDISLWRQRCKEGYAKFRDIAQGSKVFPPVFIWLVEGAGENLPLGFRRAFNAFQARANYLTEALLYAVLPSTLLILGLMIMSQIFPLFRTIFSFQRFFNLI